MMLCCAIALAVPAQEPTTAHPTGVLAPAEVERLMPPSVFFSGQSAPVQLRNSAAIRFAGEGITLAGLVDTGGYSSGIRDRYQFYLITDTAIEAGGKRIAPGAYGGGFLSDGFLLMDLGAHELLRLPVMADAGMKRPRPLQFVAGPQAGEYRLYLGRSYISLNKAR
jgi:hypothetical protein